VIFSGSQLQTASFSASTLETLSRKSGQRIPSSTAFNLEAKAAFLLTQQVGR
jgi:hypothetical protein